MRMPTILACLWPMVYLAQGNAALGQNFDGITIIELSDSEAVKAITGYQEGDAPYLVTYVSARGTYAALGDGDQRACVAWAVEGSYTGPSITFGLPLSEQSLQLVNPSVCQAFTLSISGPDRVKIEATSKVGSRTDLLTKAARDLRYEGEHQVVARVPLIAFDWGMPVFSRYDVKGVRLGPVPALRARLGGTGEFDLSPLQRNTSGTIKYLSVSIPDPSDPANSTTVAGHVAAAEVMGWPWDVLYTAAYKQTLAAPSLTDGFEQAIVERYGRPSRSGLGPGGKHLHWIFDLEGRQLAAGSASPKNCLGIRGHWIDEIDFRTIKSDIGPWGCALILLLTHDGAGGIVRWYSVQAASGYVMALNHFVRRLEDLRSMREKIQEVQAYKPKL